uniref:Uncharacterized protein n=1 Tax=Papio anubis TaxID=9555 RepID=A0A8I5NN86_PAPAN
MTLKRLRAGTSGCVSRSCPWREVVGRWWGAALSPACPPQLSQQSHCPDFFLFLCRLLSPLLKAFAQAAAFLHQGQLPDTESGYTEQLFHFLQATAQEEGIFGESQPVSPGSWRQGCLLVVAAPCRTVNPTLGRQLQSSEGLLSSLSSSPLWAAALHKRTLCPVAPCPPYLEPSPLSPLQSEVCGPKARHQCYLDLQRPRGERSHCHHLLSLFPSR